MAQGCLVATGYATLRKVVAKSLQRVRSNPRDPPMSELNRLRDELRAFAAERDWDKFHSPKNLASALAVEDAELLEPFQWLTEEQSRNLSEQQLSAVRDELADVQIYLIRLADKLDVDLLAAVREKFVRNAEKYPASAFKGSARKYSET